MAETGWYGPMKIRRHIATMFLTAALLAPAVPELVAAGPAPEQGSRIMVMVTDPEGAPARSFKGTIVLRNSSNETLYLEEGDRVDLESGLLVGSVEPGRWELVGVFPDRVSRSNDDLLSVHLPFVLRPGNDLLLPIVVAVGEVGESADRVTRIGVSSVSEAEAKTIFREWYAEAEGLSRRYGREPVFGTLTR